MARTEGFWDNIAGYIKPNLIGGANILIAGVNKYLNFNTLSGASGYGFRDNGGVLEYKDSGGAWVAFSAGGSAPEILEYANLASFPATGVVAHVYVDLATNKIYRWDATGLAYVLLSPSSGGGVSLTALEVDMGSVPVSSNSFTITDALVTPATKILVFTSPATATGRLGNDWELDSANFSAKAGTGNFTLAVLSQFLMVGKRSLYYQLI